MCIHLSVQNLLLKLQRVFFSSGFLHVVLLEQKHFHLFSVFEMSYTDETTRMHCHTLYFE